MRTPSLSADDVSSLEDEDIRDLFGSASFLGEGGRTEASVGSGGSGGSASVASRTILPSLASDDDGRAVEEERAAAVGNLTEGYYVLRDGQGGGEGGGGRGGEGLVVPSRETSALGEEGGGNREDETPSDGGNEEEEGDYGTSRTEGTVGVAPSDGNGSDEEGKEDPVAEGSAGGDGDVGAAALGLSGILTNIAAIKDDIGRMGAGVVARVTDSLSSVEPSYIEETQGGKSSSIKKWAAPFAAACVAVVLALSLKGMVGEISAIREENRMMKKEIRRVRSMLLGEAAEAARFRDREGERAAAFEERLGLLEAEIGNLSHAIKSEPPPVAGFGPSSANPSDTVEGGPMMPEMLARLAAHLKNTAPCFTESLSSSVMGEDHNTTTEKTHPETEEARQSIGVDTEDPSHERHPEGGTGSGGPFNLWVVLGWAVVLVFSTTARRLLGVEPENEDSATSNDGASAEGEDAATSDARASPNAAIPTDATESVPEEGGTETARADETDLSTKEADAQSVEAVPPQIPEPPKQAGAAVDAQTTEEVPPQIPEPPKQTETAEDAQSADAAPFTIPMPGSGILSAGSAGRSAVTPKVDNMKVRTKRTPSAKADKIVKISYAVVRDPQIPRGTASATGTVAGVGSAPVGQVLASLIRAASPESPEGCIRIWSRTGPATLRVTEGRHNVVGATVIGDGFEPVDSKWLDVASSKDDKQKSKGPTVAEWAATHRPYSSTLGRPVRSLAVIVEVRPSPESPWPRASLDLPSRLRVGDFVDARDSSGRWYEAVVRSVDAHKVKVHYVGWSSKWDAWIPKSNEEEDREDVAVALSRQDGRVGGESPPAPLWSKTPRWRDDIEVGDVVEVREAVSPADRPRWFQAVVRAVGKEDDPIHDLEGGAEVETQEQEGTKALLMLGRKRQVLVEVPKERVEGDRPRIDGADTSVPAADPPHLRWVNLYGEEIAMANTHNRRS